MLNLIKMDLYRLKKRKTLWIFSLIIFVVTFVVPLIIKGFTMLLNNMQATVEGLDPESAMEITAMNASLIRQVNFSDILRMPFGGLTSLLIFFLVFAASFFYADVGHGYIKNLAGQIPRISMLSVSKLLVTLIPLFLMFLSALLGSFLGNLLAFGVRFDDQIGGGLLELLTKLLMAWAMASVTMLFSAGLRIKSLGVIMAVFLGAGIFSILYVPLSFGIQKLFKLKDFYISYYLPDQLFGTDMGAANISLLNGVVSSLIVMALSLGLTVLLNNKRDIK